MGVMMQATDMLGYIKDHIHCDSYICKMNINFVFNMLANLSFAVNFNSSIGENQTYFVFNGNDTAAHFSRINSTVSLLLLSGMDYNLYEAYNVSNDFIFKWNGFTINGKEMISVNSSRKITEIEFDSYSFFSPYLKLKKDNLDVCLCEQRVFGCNDINYGLIALIMFGVCIGLRSDEAVQRIWSRLLRVQKLTDINETSILEEEEEDARV